MFNIFMNIRVRWPPMNRKLYDLAAAMMAAAYLDDMSVNAEDHITRRLILELGLSEVDARHYAERVADEYAQAYTNSGPSRPWPDLEQDESSSASCFIERYRENAAECLMTMSLDDPVRSSFVDLVGYDPNHKWSAPVGNFDTSRALSEIIHQKKLRPDFDF